MQAVAEEDKPKVTYFTHRGIAKSPSNVKKKERRGCVAYYSYDTMIAFIDNFGTGYLRRDKFSTSTAKHRGRIQRDMDDSNCTTIMELDCQDFWEHMRRVGIDTLFCYSGTSWDRPPLKKKNA